jgi:hypothetical protein
MVCAAAILASGCSLRTADLTLISTKNIDLSDATLDARSGKRFKGEDCAYSLLGLLPLGVPNLEEAVDRALEAGGGNVMVDEVTYVRSYYFILFGMSCVDAEGTVLVAPTGSQP